MTTGRSRFGTRARRTRLHATDLEGRKRRLAKRLQGAGESQLQIIRPLPDDPFHVLLNDEGRAVRVDVRNGGRLTVEPPARAGRALAPVKSARCRARDGVVVEAYRMRPVGAEGPGPVLVMPHDGSDERDGWGFDPGVQCLAARGFTILQPNARGSTGSGRELWRRGRASVR